MVKFDTSRHRCLYLLAPFILSGACQAYQPDFENMRSRELRKNLLKWGHSSSELKLILDRKELKRLAIEFHREKRKYDDDATFRAKGVKFSIGCIIIAFILVFWEPINALLSSLRGWVDGFIYQLKERMRLINMSITNRIPIATLSFGLAIVIEVFIPLLQLSICASWIIPVGSPLRKFLLPMPSLSLTMNHFLGGGQQKSPSSTFDIGSMGINVAPMIIMWICNQAKLKLEEFGASKLIKYVDEKQQRRDDREAVRRFRAKVQTESETVFMDFADSHIDGASCPASSSNTDHNAKAETHQPLNNRSQRLPSPFEFQQSYMRSSFLSKMNAEVITHDDQGEIFANSDSVGADVNNCVDDGDFWLDDDS